GIRDFHVTGVQTCALPICRPWWLCADFVVHLAFCRLLFDHCSKGLCVAHTTLRQGGVTIVADLKKGARITGSTRTKLANDLKKRSEERRVGKERRSREAEK